MLAFDGSEMHLLDSVGSTGLCLAGSRLARVLWSKSDPTLEGVVLIYGPTGLEHAFEATAGDFVYIPAGEIHVEANASDREPLVVVLTRNCPDSHVVYLDGGPDGSDDVPAPC